MQVQDPPKKGTPTKACEPPVSRILEAHFCDFALQALLAKPGRFRVQGLLGFRVLGV